MRLENWSVVVRDPDPYKAPEAQQACLSGNVYDHPTYSDGNVITTSRIVKVEDGKVHTVSGSVYELGEVDPEYERMFPGARGRLFKVCVSSTL